MLANTPVSDRAKKSFLGVIFDGDYDFEGPRSPKAHRDTVLRNQSSHLRRPFIDLKRKRLTYTFLLLFVTLRFTLNKYKHECEHDPQHSLHPHACPMSPRMNIMSPSCRSTRRSGAAILRKDVLLVPTHINRMQDHLASSLLSALR